MEAPEFRAGIGSTPVSQALAQPLVAVQRLGWTARRIQRSHERCGDEFVVGRSAINSLNGCTAVVAAPMWTPGHRPSHDRIGVLLPQ
jgi:hypothetical protein